MKILHTPVQGTQNDPISHAGSSIVNGNSNSTTELRFRAGKVLRIGREKLDAKRPEHFESGTGESRFMSRLFLMTQKEGLVQRNYLQTSDCKHEGDQAAQICFQATVLWMSEPQLCRNVGEIGNQQELEAAGLNEIRKAQQKVRNRSEKERRWQILGLILPELWCSHIPEGRARMICMTEGNGQFLHGLFALPSCTFNVLLLFLIFPFPFFSSLSQKVNIGDGKLFHSF